MGRAVLAVAVAAFLSVCAAGGEAVREAAPDADISPGSGLASAAKTWRGVFEPRAEAVVPAEISMRVERMPRHPGEFCQEGEVLVEFDSTLPSAALETAKAKLNAARLNRDGIEGLFRRGQSTPVELARAEGEVAHARLELAAATRDAAACRVVAPFSGKMVERKVREFEWASKGAPLFLLVDDAVLRVRFFLPEEYFSRIRLGDSVLVRVPSVSRDVQGVVTRLGVVFDPVSRTFDVWAEVDNSDDSLRAGMTAEVVWPVPETAPVSEIPE